MKPRDLSPVVLLADDDADDRFLAKEALERSGYKVDLRMVEDGEELLEYLNKTGRYAQPGAAPEPVLILLDLNMPRKDGREALAEIRTTPAIRHLPVVVMSTSRAEEDIFVTYDLGVNSFVTKPVTFEGLVEVMRKMGVYWLDTVVLPARKRPL